MKPIAPECLIVIPARNEERTIESVVAQARLYGPVVVVDDGSDDATSELAQRAGATVLRHIVNLGKGAALKTGCDYALQCGAPAIVVLDADAQHNPKLIPRFLGLLSRCDVVFGFRSFTAAMPAVFRFGNRVISALAQLLYGVQLRDTQCGYRAFTASAYGKIRWHSWDYSVESEMVARVGRRKLRYAELPIETIYQDTYKGTTVLDGIKIVMKMLWWKVS